MPLYSRFTILALVSASLTMAASFTQSTICSTGAGRVTGTSSCRNDNDGYALASTSNSLSLTENMFTLRQEAGALAGYNSYASATNEAVFSIGAAGSIRQGLVRGYFSDNYASNGGQGSTLIQFARQTIDPTSGGYRSREQVIYPVAIQLGTPILFQSLVSASAIRASNFGESAAGWTEPIMLSLSFFEADGTTPVAIAELPEPGAGMLLAAGGVLLTIFRKLRAK